MENQEEQKPESEEVVEQSVEQKQEEKVVEERPEKNWKAELERKNREIEKLRQEKETLQANSPQKRDAQDVTTWPDHELKAIIHSNDPQLLALKDQAEETLFNRRIERVRTKEREQDKRFAADIELRKEYPEAMDPSSQFSTRMEEVMYQYDLQKSPAGRLAAAKLVAAELHLGNAKANATGRKAEDARVRDVKAQMVDGDRPKPTEAINPKRNEELEANLNSKNLRQSTAAMSEILKNKGLTRDSFFKK